MPAVADARRAAPFALTKPAVAERRSML